MLSDSKIPGKYPAGFCVGVYKNDHSVFTGNADGGEDREVHTAPRNAGDDFFKEIL